MTTLQNPSPPLATFRDGSLDDIREKVRTGRRLSLSDGERLFATRDIWSVLQMANDVRTRLHANVAYYNVNRHLNYSNVCALSCRFCEFYAKPGDAKAYARDLAYVREQASQAVESGATEMHVVGGLHPSLGFSYYTDLVGAIREVAAAAGSDLHVKAFTAVEIVHLARMARVYKGTNIPGDEGRALRREGIRWVLERLKAAGLGSLPGGGAEVFDDRVHDEAFKGKIRSDVWLDVHKSAHELGLNTNATLLYGHIETRHDRLIHMDMLRRAQDEALARLGYTGVASRENDAPGIPEGGGHLGYTPGARADEITLTRPGIPLPEHVVYGRGKASVPGGYYQTIIPLPFIPDGCDLEHLPGPGGAENYRTLAVARLMLDNFPHVKAFWIMQTLPMAQVMLQSGADDMDGTVVWYDITHVGAASTHQEVTAATLQRLIREAGFRPVERDTLYRPIEREGKRWRVAL